ncbi:MAG TPA: FlgD immunoglobulin-like domain containing protein [Terriglobales bacterium]|nr:FlgD immunoglobulin-like domain containing protein [Terriglobales bacterium]
MKKTLTFLALILLLSSPVFAKIYQVPSAFIATIQGGINVAKNGDTVLVMPGTYYENINFKGENILVASNFIFDHDNSTILKTVIDGQNKASVVTFHSGEDSTASIQGFTITHGHNDMGGGIYSYGSSPKIAYNVITQNVTTPLYSSSSGAFGGGIYCRIGSVIIENNSIVNNLCKPGSEGVGSGAGIFCVGKKAPVIRYNLIDSNIALSSPVYKGIGGGIALGDSSGQASIYNNTITNNRAEGGGGIYNISFAPGARIFNNIIAFNSSGITAPDMWQLPFRPVVSYNNFWENTDGDLEAFPSEVGDTSWGFNRNGVPCDSFRNIIRDPLFVDTANFDFHLLSYSPCIDAGDPDSPLDLDSTIADIGAFYYPHTPTFVREDDQNSLQRFELSQNFPNPFNPSTTIPYRAGSREVKAGSPIHTTLKIYNILGQLVRTLVDEVKIPGSYEVTWNGKDNSGKEIASGTYFYQLKTGSVTATKKMILLR